jgi:hypothetical protein
MTTQVLSPNYLQFGLVLATLFLFGVVYAYLVRWLANSNVQGQTAYAVVGGVGVTVLVSAVVIGMTNALYLIICFAASGLPMIVEYVNRVHGEHRKDQQSAQQVAKDLLK